MSNEVLLVIVSLGLTVFLFILKRIWEIPKQLDQSLADLEHTIMRRLDEVGNNFTLLKKRMDITDRFLSRVLKIEYDSEMIARSGTFPKIDG